MTTDNETLRRLADATAHPEPWTARENSDGTSTIVDRDGMVVAVTEDADAKFIAAATPSKVIELLDEVHGRRYDPNLVAEVKRLQAEVELLKAPLQLPTKVLLYVARGTRTLDSGDIVAADFVTFCRTELVRTVDDGNVFYRSADAPSIDVCVSELARLCPSLVIAADSTTVVAMAVLP